MKIVFSRPTDSEIAIRFKVISMNIRAYKETDQEPIIDLANRRNKDTHEFIPLTPKSFKEWIADSEPLILVSEDKQLTGFAAAEKGWPAEPDEIQITMICVEAESNAASIERELLDSCRKHSEAKGVLTTLPIGDPKIKLQEEWGFQLDGGILQLTRSLAEMPPQPPIMHG